MSRPGERAPNQRASFQAQETLSAWYLLQKGSVRMNGLPNDINVLARYLKTRTTHDSCVQQSLNDFPIPIDTSLIDRVVVSSKRDDT